MPIEYHGLWLVWQRKQLLLGCHCKAQINDVLYDVRYGDGEILFFQIFNRFCTISVGTKEIEFELHEKMNVDSVIVCTCLVYVLAEQGSFYDP